MNATKQRVVTIDDWCFAQIPREGSKKIYLAFLGKVYNHPNYADGSFVPGSTPIVAYNEETDTFITATGTHYKVGKMDEATLRDDPRHKYLLIKLITKLYPPEK